VIRRSFIGAVTVTLVVLLARTLAYATVPGPSARFLAHRAGGPTLPVLAVIVVGVGAVLAVTVCWLVGVAVRERALLERRDAEPFAVAGTCLLAVGLTLTTSLAGGLLEAYLHWRAGLGWHGLHCLVGPVHRDLIPFEAGLSLLAAAILAAARHVAIWMRRTFARLAAQVLPLPFVESPVFGDSTTLLAALRIGAASARAPPALG
jgi:hypothetical protein